MTLHSQMSSETIGEVRRDLFRIFEDPDAADHVRQGAAAMINYYGAILDERMASAASTR